MSDSILTINAGSSNLKFALFKTNKNRLELSVAGYIESIENAPHFTARDSYGNAVDSTHWPAQTPLTFDDIIDALLTWVDVHLDGGSLVAIGHRVVHGGPQYAEPVRLTDEVMATLESFVSLAPLHQPHNLAAIKFIAKNRPSLPQIACFDTAFHRGHQTVVDRFGLPRDIERLGVKRYGFHGLSYEYIASALHDYAPNIANGRVIIAHLGNGASLCAIKNGRSVDSSMGFSALDGLVMGTRCGTLDPGIILYMQQHLHMTPHAIQDMLYTQSGLLGVSGISSDMRVLLASNDPQAKEAIELFVFRITREIGALAMTLGGLDGIVFTAGIGEHAPEIRRQVCERIAWLGLDFDDKANAQGNSFISHVASRIQAWVIPTNEELIIAQHTRLMSQPEHRIT